MVAWEQRPVEIANLLNPAFCALLLVDSSDGYRANYDGGMPYAIAFLILPLVLHDQTRETLPRTTRTDLHVWLQNHPEVRYEAGRRIVQLIPYTKEALIFGMHHGLINIDGQGALLVQRGMSRRTVPSLHSSSEILVIRKRAAFLGRWFAKLGDPIAIYAMWGIRP